MTPEAMLDEIMTRVRTLETGQATANVRLEYLVQSATETGGRVSALERWRWTAAGVVLVLAIYAQPLIGALR